jgi:hypothetical protein
MSRTPAPLIPASTPAPAATRTVRGPILRVGCSDEALVAYLTLALRGLADEVDQATLTLRKRPCFLLARKLVRELDTRTDERIGELLTELSTCGPGVSAGELSAALRELLTWRGAR